MESESLHHKVSIHVSIHVGYLKAMHVAENTILVLSNGQAENLQGRKGPYLELPSLHTRSTAA